MGKTANQEIVGNNVKFNPQSLADHSKAHPLLLACLDKWTSSSIIGSHHGPIQFSFTTRHAVLDNLKPPCLCLFYLKSEGGLSAYMGIAKSKRAVTTLDSAIKISNSKIINPSEPAKLVANLSKKIYRAHLKQALSAVSVLTPGLSRDIITKLGSDESNANAYEHLSLQLFGEKHLSRRGREQNDAIELALKVLGLDRQSLAAQIKITDESDSCLQFYEAGIGEDNQIAHDTRIVPGYELFKSAATGHAVFVHGDDQLDIYTANRGPLERALGVDLIYANMTQRNIVMVQYKMLERESPVRSGVLPTWNFRPDTQFWDEWRRMNALQKVAVSSDYRFNSEPFYFKFTKRFGIGTPGSMILPREHLNIFLRSSDAKGPRGGLRVSYEGLRGRYLRETEFLAMIRSGYIGTTANQTTFLLPLIEGLIGEREENALVYAVQRKIPSCEPGEADD